MDPHFYKQMKYIMEFKKVWKTYLEEQFRNSENILFDKTFKIEEKKVPSEFQNFASR